MKKILYRIMTITMLLAVSSFVLQGCSSGNDSGTEAPEVEDGDGDGDGGGSEELVDPIDWTVESGKEQVVILIKRSLYADLSVEIEQYVKDVEANFPTVQLNVLQGAWTMPKQVRETIKLIYEAKALDGIILVGDMPMHKFWMHDQPNPNMLYYEDFDLRFDDDGQATAYMSLPAPKIWVSNMRAVSDPDLPGTEELRAFFKKTHAYYNGEQRINRQALFLAGWEWPGGAKASSEDMAPLFPDENDRVVYTYDGGSDPGNENLGATETNYRNAFKQNWTLFYIQVHSFPRGHDFDNGGHISSAEVSKLGTSALITVNHGCSGGNYLMASPEINLTQAYVFSGGVGQCAVAQVRTGMVYNHEKIYERLCAGDYMGKAYFECRKDAEDETYTSINGLILYGNPFVKIAPAGSGQP